MQMQSQDSLPRAESSPSVEGFVPQPTVSHQTSSGEKEKPHRCSLCKLSFSRATHLSRHIRLHTGGNGYQCSCGQRFSRNDGLAKHLRHCEVAQRDSEVTGKIELIGCKKQTRAKRACDYCAKLKLKCSFSVPCAHCRRKQLPCTYTRSGYVDPYESFQLGNEWTGTQSNIANRRVEQLNTVDNNFSAHIVYATSSNGPDGVQGGERRFCSGLAPTNAECGVMDLSSMLSYEMDTSSMIHEQNINDSLSMDFSAVGFDVMSNLTFPLAAGFDANIFSLSYDKTQQTYASDTEISIDIADHAQGMDDTSKSSQLSPRDAFTLWQLDPIEAKCTEIKQSLYAGEPFIQRDDVNCYITRENLLTCTQLFGKHLSRNIPILHSSTFVLAEAPKILVLAVILGGACYSDNAIPHKHIVKFAMSLLILIERQSHEMNMQIPMLPTIQASIIACVILTCSRHDGARRFAHVHFSRCISMADRLGIFNKKESMSYNSQTEETFNWPLWVEQESQRRAACEIFSLDVAFCIFLGKQPSFSASTLKIQMPCYEKCWEATSSSSCLRYLQTLPAQLDMSTGIQKLRGFCEEEQVNFEVSNFGMFILILALHSSLFLAIQENPDPHFTSNLVQGLFHGIDSFNIKRQQLTGENTTVIADRTIELCGSPAMQKCNKSLTAWKRLWDRLRIPNQDIETRTFSADPLPFWYLAKLYQVLYYYGDLIGCEMELRVPLGRGGQDQWQTGTQDTIVSLLAEFREQTDSKNQNRSQLKEFFMDQVLGNSIGLSKLMNAY